MNSDEKFNFLHLLVLIAAVPTVVYLVGRKMSKPEKMMRPITGGLNPHQLQQLLPYKDWLVSAGLEYRNCFRFGSIEVGVFQHGNDPRFFSFIFRRKTVWFSAESYLEDLTVLDTNTTGTLGVMPRPGAFAQSFPNNESQKRTFSRQLIALFGGLPSFHDMSPQEVWQAHLDGEAHLTKKFGFKWVPLKKPYYGLIIECMQLRMTYTRSQMFWPFRVLYRVIVSRHHLANRTIAQQYP
jgi:hypothetical protein